MLHWQTFFRVIPRLRSVVTVLKQPFRLSIYSCPAKKRWKKTFACIYKLKGTEKLATSENVHLVLQHSAAKWPENRCCAFLHPRIKPVLEQLGRCRLRSVNVVGESQDWFYFFQQNLYILRVLPAKNQELSPVYGMTPRVLNLSNQLSVFAQLATTRFVSRQVWSNVGGKTRIIAFNTYCSKASK